MKSTETPHELYTTPLTSSKRCNQQPDILKVRLKGIGITKGGLEGALHIVKFNAAEVDNIDVEDSVSGYRIWMYQRTDCFAASARQDLGSLGLFSDIPEEKARKL